jgi:2-haloacid dehalogenase
MKYDLFLFDLDDTLLDFKESEKLSFHLCMQSLGIKTNIEQVFSDYQVINKALWKALEEAKTTQELLKVERFRKVFESHKIEIDPAVASLRYLDTLPETVVLIDHAVETCEWLSQHGEIGIITNGIEYVQAKRINKSKIAPYISFVSVSEACGFAKPDVRFFDYCAKMAKKFSKEKTIIVGDRIEADIQGAHNFGIDSCWFNPHKISRPENLVPSFEISHLSELKKVLR